MTEITDIDRERAHGVAVAIFGDRLPEGSREFLAIAQALADARGLGAGVRVSPFESAS